ncbi:MAG: hypothetical protein JW791_05450 [Nanoarchaeota archaeon]|nr:hypothetical protein [Nanoarchaeota archaeon]
MNVLNNKFIPLVNKLKRISSASWSLYTSEELDYQEYFVIGKDLDVEIIREEDEKEVCYTMYVLGRMDDVFGGSTNSPIESIRREALILSDLWDCIDEKRTEYELDKKKKSIGIIEQLKPNFRGGLADNMLMDE